MFYFSEIRIFYHSNVHALTLFTYRTAYKYLFLTEGAAKLEFYALMYSKLTFFSSNIIKKSSFSRKTADIIKTKLFF